MSDRTTIKQLEKKVAILNHLRNFKSKTMYFNKETNLWENNPNVYYIDKAYGGYRLCQICSNGKGSKDITKRTNKKELWSLIDIMIYGYELGKRSTF